MFKNISIVFIVAVLVASLTSSASAEMQTWSNTWPHVIVGTYDPAGSSPTVNRRVYVSSSLKLSEVPGFKKVIISYVGGDDEGKPYWDFAGNNGLLVSAVTGGNEFELIKGSDYSSSLSNVGVPVEFQYEITFAAPESINADLIKFTLQNIKVQTANIDNPINVQVFDQTGKLLNEDQLSVHTYPELVSQVTFEPQSPTQMVISWVTPKYDRSPVAGYEVRLQTRENSTGYSFANAFYEEVVTTPYITLTDLIEGKQYLVQIKTILEDGNETDEFFKDSYYPFSMDFQSGSVIVPTPSPEPTGDSSIDTLKRLEQVEKQVAVQKEELNEVREEVSGLRAIIDWIREKLAALFS